MFYVQCLGYGETQGIIILPGYLVLKVALLG